MNIHTPQRESHETQDEYRIRQRASREATKALIAGVSVRWYVGIKLPSKRDLRRAAISAARQVAPSPKPLTVRKRKLGQPIKPTWPHSADQLKQGRPVQVLRPNREPDPGKRQKPKSQVAKRMDRPERAAVIERGHAKLMRFFGSLK